MQLIKFPPFSSKALKESFIKAIGTGLGFNLQRVEFHLAPEPLTQKHVLRQTKMHLDEEEEEDWIFEVSLVSVKGQKVIHGNIPNMMT